MLEPAAGREGAFEVLDLEFNGLGEQMGLTWGDYITEIDVSEPGRPAKALVYPFGLVAVGFVLVLQVARRRRLEAAQPGT